MIKLCKIITLFAAVIAVMPGFITGDEQFVRTIEVAADTDAMSAWASFEHRVITKTNQTFPDIAQTEIEFCAGSNTPSASDEEYLLALAGFNNAVNEDVLPEAILYPTTVHEVRKALNVSLTLLEDTEDRRKKNGQVCVRACGNSFAGVSSACHEGVVIDLSNLTISGQTPDITYDSFTAIVTIGASVKQEELHDFLGARAKALPLGAWTGICVSGFVLGGGFSEISRAYGLACDHLVELVIVLPDKDEPVTATMNNRYSDLFWAGCGGGGGLGVVISMSFKTFDEPQVLLYEEALAVSELQPVLNWWSVHNSTQIGVDQEKLGFSIAMSSNDHEVAIVKLLYPLPLTVDIGLAETNFKTLILSFWPKKNDVRLSGPISFTDYNLLDVSSDRSRQHRCGFWGRHKSNFLKHITMDDVSLLSKQMMKKATLPNLELASTRRAIINAWGGRIEENTNTAFWGRDAGFEVNLEVDFDPLFPSTSLFSESPCIDSTSDKWDAVCNSHRSFNLKRWAEGWLHMASSTLCNYSGDPQCKYSFINHISEFSNDPESYFGDHLLRLKNIKNHHDPRGKIRVSWEVVEERGPERQDPLNLSNQIPRAGTLDKLPMQLLGYLPLYDKLPDQSLLQQFNIIFLFAATTLQRDEQNDGRVKYFCTEMCELGFADSSEEKFAEYAKESVKNARTSVLLTVGGHAMNSCWKYCYGKEDKLAQDIADYVYNNGLDGVDFNVEEDLSPMLLRFIETLVIKTHHALNTRNSMKKWMLSHAPMAHHCDLNVETAERDFFHGLDYIPLFQRLIDAGHLSFIFVQYYNSWPVASLQKNQLFESFVGHFNRLERSFGADKIVVGLCSGGCQPASIAENGDAAAIMHRLQYYSSRTAYGPTIGGFGFWKITNPETAVVVRHVFERFRQQDVVESKTTSEVELPVSAITIVILIAVSVFVLVTLFSRESSSIASTWNIHNQERIISKELPGSLPVFIPMYNESIEEVEKTCANFRQDTISNIFVRKELMLYFIVDNDQRCDAVKTVLQIAGKNVIIDDLEEELPLQLNIPYYAGKIHGIPFKMFLKGAKSSRSHIKKGKRFSALLFVELVKNDADTNFLEKNPWAALCLDADVVTLPCSIEHLVVQMQCDEKITATCGNISPSVNQRGLAVRVQAAEYFFQNRIVRNSEALFGVVTCCPGAFLLMQFAAFHKAATENFSIDTPSSSCLMQNALDLGEDRFLTSLLLIHESKWTSFIPAADCTTAVPDSFAALAKQRRRWFNSNVANDIYILLHFTQLFRSMVIQDKTKFCVSTCTIGIVRFVYFAVSTLGRLAGALFSTLFSILLMAKTSGIFQATMCANQGTYGSHYFCGNGQALYYTFVGAGVLWATVLIWSFHHSARNPKSVFARHNVFWLRANLASATISMVCGTVAMAIYGEELQKHFMVLSAIVLFWIFLLLIVNMADSRSPSFGINLIASLLVYAIVGLPFLAFIQPLVALPQIDNFKWGTREVSRRSSHLDSSLYQQQDYSGLRRKEKFMFLAMVYILNGGVFFGIGFLAGGDFILAVFSCVFIAAQVLQATFGIIHNVRLSRQQKTFVS